MANPGGINGCKKENRGGREGGSKQVDATRGRGVGRGGSQGPLALGEENNESVVVVAKARRGARKHGRERDKFPLTRLSLPFIIPQFSDFARMVWTRQH